MNHPTITHPELVAKLSKTGEQILATLTPEAAHNWHMVTGLSGEIGELIEAWEHRDRENMIEEVGDIEFYLEGLRQGTHLVREEVQPAICLAFRYQFAELTRAGAAALDAVKKQAIYNQPLDVSKLARHLVRIDALLEGIRAKLIKCTRDECLQANIAKLSKRYNGCYSDKAAQRRADKVAE